MAKLTDYQQFIADLCRLEPVNGFMLSNLPSLSMDVIALAMMDDETAFQDCKIEIVCGAACIALSDEKQVGAGLQLLAHYKDLCVRAARVKVLHDVRAELERLEMMEQHFTEIMRASVLG